MDWTVCLRVASSSMRIRASLCVSSWMSWLFAYSTSSGGTWNSTSLGRRNVRLNDLVFPLSRKKAFDSETRWALIFDHLIFQCKTSWKVDTTLRCDIISKNTIYRNCWKKNKKTLTVQHPSMEKWLTLGGCRSADSTRRRSWSTPKSATPEL